MDEQYHRILEAISDGAIAVNPLTDTIVETNSAACRMLSYSREELMGRPLATCIAPDYQRLLTEYIRSAGPNGDFEMQALMLRKDGAPIPIELRGVLFEHRGYPHRLLMLRDLTAGVQAQEHVWEAEAQYRGIFDATGDGLIIIDPDTRMVEVNPAACRLHGYSHDELIGLPLTALVDPRSHSLVADLVRTARQGDMARAQAVALCKDGPPFDVEIQGTSFTYQGQRHVLAVVRDITERLRAYELLEQRVAERTRELTTLLDVAHHVASTLELQPLLELILDQLKVVAEYSGSSLLIFDGSEAVIVATRGPNPEEHVLQRRFPLDRGRLIWDTIRGDEVVIIDDVWGDTASALAYRNVVGDLLETTFAYIRSWLAVPLMLKERAIGLLALSHGEPGYFTQHHATVARAIAAQVAVAIDNARLYEQAQQVAVLEERQRLARELHDSVSQVLYGIALAAQTARTLLDRDASQVAQPLAYVLTLAETGIAEMRALIFELLPSALETDGLVAALQQQVAAIRARYGIAVDLALDEEPAVSLGVKEALYRIAQEALHNTVKHAHARMAQVRLSTDRTGVALEVWDDGVGFDPSGPFPGHRGQSTMRERATRLGGSLEVVSAPDHGTRVQARIPV